ncbi:uncharacterized protein [Clytia hemisphaerica]|uniref:ShKT domain-containing protein n=1 Tax=Clytia hemisphaerica TaxID=252671 RepID=A0A7M6DLF9_9CNID
MPGIISYFQFSTIHILTHMAILWSADTTQSYQYLAQQWNENEIKVPPPLLTTSRTKRSLGLNYTDVLKSKNGKKGKDADLSKYKKQTEVARHGRPQSKLDEKPFEIKKNYMFLKVTVAECVYAHNQVRRKHGLPNLLWDPELSYNAEEWALILASRSAGLIHSKQPSNRNGIYYGENLFYGMGSVYGHNCSEAVYAWYSEIRNFEWSNPRYSSAIGHFYQLVYKDTKYFGVGIACAENVEESFIVARYLEGSQSSKIAETPEPLADSPEITIPSLTIQPTPEPIVERLFISDEGGWSEWVPVTKCSTTCGRGQYLERRYCIDVTAGTEEPKTCGEGDRYRVAECAKQLPCPMDQDPNEKDGECNDLFPDKCQSSVVPLGGRMECRQENNGTFMTNNCKKTCMFCKPCVNYHKDCPAYSVPPYSYCTDNEYSPWMEWKCPKSCAYCNMNQTVYEETDCYDLTYDCTKWAFELNYCRSDEYAEFMSGACKESCSFCTACHDANPYCQQLKEDYHYCTSKDQGINLWMAGSCAGTCNYCFDPKNFETNIDKVNGTRPP